MRENQLSRAVRALIVLLGLALFGMGDDRSTFLAPSLAYHDPGRVWVRSRIHLRLDEGSGDGTSRTSLVVIDTPGLAFELKTKIEGKQVVMSVLDDVASASLDGRLDFSKVDAEKFGLTAEAVKRRRDRYSYVYALPMSLADPRATVGAPVPGARYEGRLVTRVRIVPERRTGRDPADFFFDPITHALAGYQFFPDLAKNEGEFVILKGEIDCGGRLKLPKVRARYAYPNRAYRGQDTIESCSVETILGSF